MDNRAVINDSMDQAAFGRRYHLEADYQDAEEQRHVRIEETDPHIYRVPVKRGKQFICLLKMHHRLIELKVRANNPDKYVGLAGYQALMCDPFSPIQTTSVVSMSRYLTCGHARPSLLNSWSIWDHIQLQHSLKHALPAERTSSPSTSVLCSPNEPLQHP